MSQCDTQTGSCSTASHKEDCCPVERSLQEQCCPVEKATEMWQKAFFCAMKETSVDILKEKIRKEYGPVMEKKAAAVVEAMGVHWQSLMAQGKAQADLREAFKKIYQSAQK